MLIVDLFHDDALDMLEQMEGCGFDMVFCDPPYGTTYANWDSVLDFDRLWFGLRRACRKDAPMIFTAVQPFTSLLICSNLKEFKVEWIWDKVNASNFANAKRHPMKVHESVLVFCSGAAEYHPIKTKGKPNHAQGMNANNNESVLRKINDRVGDDLSGLKYPKSIQTFPKHSSNSKNHPTEKPVDLCEYFIRTYSSEGAIVFDPTMGSGTTGVAAIRAGRGFVGIEKDENYFQIAQARIDSEILSNG